MSMSLEQVRDALRNMGGKPTNNFNQWADALDAHIAGMGEPVAEVYTVLGDWGQYEEYLSVRFVTGAAIPPDGTKLYTPTDIDIAAVREVTYDMVRIAEHFCPTDLPHLDKQRWKAKKINELLTAALPKE